MEKSKKQRCSHIDCRKKIGLMKFGCKCGKEFCVTHKLPELHKCSYDYLCNSKESLETKLIKVVNEKVIKI